MIESEQGSLYMIDKYQSAFVFHTRADTERR